MPSDDRNLKIPSTNDILDLDQPPNLAPARAHVLCVPNICHDIDKVGGGEQRPEEGPDQERNQRNDEQNGERVRLWRWRCLNGRRDALRLRSFLFAKATGNFGEDAGRPTG